MPVPGWVEQIAAAYSSQHAGRLLSPRCSRRPGLRRIEDQGRPLGYWALLLNSLTALVPLL